jgi:hypothetical protein
VSLPRLLIVPPLHCPSPCQQLARGRLHARIVLWGCCSNAALMFRAFLNRSCMDCLVRTAKEEGVTKLWSGGEAQCQPDAHPLLLARLPSHCACPTSPLEKSCAVDRCQNDAGVQPPLRRAQLSLLGAQASRLLSVRRCSQRPCLAATPRPKSGSTKSSPRSGAPSLPRCLHLRQPCALCHATRP